MATSSDSFSVLALWRDGDETVAQAWEELTLIEDGTINLRHDGWGWVPSQATTRFEAKNPRALMVKAGSQVEAMTMIIDDLTRRLAEAEEALQKESITPHRAAILASGFLQSQEVQIEDFDNPACEWPSMDRIERRKLDELDPLARAIQERLDPDDDLPGDPPVYMTTTFITGGYSEYTVEQEYEFEVECGPYVVTTGGTDQFDLDQLIRWIDGHDVSGIRVVTKGQA